MLALPTTSTYILTSSLLLTMFLSQNQDFMNWLLPSAKESKESVEELPEKKEPNPEKITRILPKVEKPLERPSGDQEKPGETPVSTAHKQLPSQSSNEKKATPGPSQPRQEEMDVVQAPIPLRQELPEKEAAAYDEKVARGLKLSKDRNEDLTWTGFIATWMIDHLQREQRARLVVKTKDKDFVFTGGLTEPGEIYEVNEEIREKYFSGVSRRGMTVDSNRGRHLIRALNKEHRISSTIQVWVLFSVDIDYMILAAQDDAARKAGLDLEEVAETTGIFKQRGGLPFDYKVSKIKTRKGEWRDL